MKRMETRLESRKENLSETSFFDGQIIKGYLPDNTIAIRCNEHKLDVIEKSHQWTTSCFKTFLQAIGVNIRWLKKSCMYKNHLLEPVTLTVKPLYRYFANSDILKKRLAEKTECEGINNNRILKLGVYDVVVIFTADNADRLEELGCKMPILKELKKEQVDKEEL
ncbi:hypothetical protein V1478_000078 [Vespula squamosa]|uniref:60S ribosomal protein L10P insertion domain-containing protein n=1 Tax=Vespula squamosa TaxID=30214 RepID=A0ABD2C921_VESSQ